MESVQRSRENLRRVNFSCTETTRFQTPDIERYIGSSEVIYSFGLCCENCLMEKKWVRPEITFILEFFFELGGKTEWR